MARFHDLPLELRRMIYGECLIVGKIFPYNISDTSDISNISDTDDTASEVTASEVTASEVTAQEWAAREASNFDLPNIALLQVSKMIRREAEPILYQRNNVQLGSAEFSQRFFERCLNTPERRSWLKSVSIWLGSDDLSNADRKVVLDTELGSAREDMLEPRRKDDAHETWSWSSNKLHHAYKKYLMETIWPRKTSPLLELCSLNKLVVDIECARCRAGCCTMRRHAVQSFSKGFARGFPTEFEIDFLGEGKVALENLIRSWTTKRIAELEDNKLLLDIFPNEDEE